MTAEFNRRRIDFVFPNQSPSLFLVHMKKRPVNWPLGNPDFVAWEVEAEAGLLVARRNHAGIAHLAESKQVNAMTLFKFSRQVCLLKLSCHFRPDKTTC